VTAFSSTAAVFTDGPCPFVTCLDTGPHGHDICPECGAVKFGNAFCATCVRSWTHVSEKGRAELLAAVERNAK
jgi:hypothetical protein